MRRRRGSTYRRLERGSYRNPPLRYLTNCALALGLELEDVIEDDHRLWYVFHVKASAPPDPKRFWRFPDVERRRR